MVLVKAVFGLCFILVQVYKKPFYYSRAKYKKSFCCSVIKRLFFFIMTVSRCSLSLKVIFFCVSSQLLLHALLHADADLQSVSGQ